MYISYLQIFILSVVMELLFISIILILKQKGFKSNNRIFALILITLSIIVSSSLIYTFNIDNIQFRQLYLLNNFLYLPGLLLYFYIKSVYYYQFHIKDSLHFVPFFIMIFFLLFASFFIKRWPYIPYLLIINAVSALLVNIIYLYNIVMYLKVSQKVSNQNLPRLKESNVRWFIVFISGCYIILFFKFVLIIINNLFDLYILEYYKYESLVYVVRFVYFISAFIFFYVIIYIAITKHDFFFKQEKYKKSILKDNEKVLIKKRLLKYIEEEKPYFDPELSLNRLADLIAVSRKNLSQIINQEFKQNFNDFINKYRIEESKQILLMNPEKSILEVLLEVGFNSKPTFNNFFKKYTGLTPKEFRKR